MIAARLKQILNNRSARWLIGFGMLVKLGLLALAWQTVSPPT